MFRDQTLEEVTTCSGPDHLFFLLECALGGELYAAVRDESPYLSSGSSDSLQGKHRSQRFNLLGFGAWGLGFRPGFRCRSCACGCCPCSCECCGFSAAVPSSFFIAALLPLLARATCRTQPLGSKDSY